MHAGHLGDRLNLRHFLTVGMLASAALTAAFGLGQAYQIHSIWYYIVIQVTAGVLLLPSAAQHRLKSMLSRSDCIQLSPDL